MKDGIKGRRRLSFGNAQNKPKAAEEYRRRAVEVHPTERDTVEAIEFQSSGK